MPKQIDEAQLFNAVLKLWVERGYAGTTTKRIAEVAGVNEVTLFRRYGAKAELLIAAIRDRLQKVPLRSVVATGDVEADFVGIVESYVDTHRQVGAIVPLLFVEASRRPELRPALDVALENIRFLVRVIEHHQASGALRNEDPLATLSALIGPLFVVGLFGQLYPGAPQLAVEAHVRAFLHGRSPGIREDGSGAPG